MQTHEELRQEIKEQRARLSRLSEASLRVSESLDVDTVLNEVVESARALTDARYGAIVTIDESGQARDFVFSGVTPDEHRSLMEWPDAPRLFEHLRDVPGPLRVPDLAAFAKSLGFSWDLVPLTTFQVTPMLHRGVRVGNFCLGQKEGGRPFTDADEEVMVLFASQAATAIANARTYRDEQRARTDLEALVDTSPVGVAVFEAKTGRPLSFNREAKRIARALGGPDQSPSSRWMS